MPTHPRATHVAFTLSEVMIALVLITVAVLGLMGVKIYTLRASSASPDKQTASLIAVSKMSEAEEAVRQGVLASAISTSGFDDTEHERFTYRVLAEDSVTPPGLVNVDVWVRWTDKTRTGEYKLHCRFNKL